MLAKSSEEDEQISRQVNKVLEKNFNCADKDIIIRNIGVYTDN